MSAIKKKKKHENLINKNLHTAFISHYKSLFSERREKIALRDGVLQSYKPLPIALKAP